MRFIPTVSNFCDVDPADPFGAERYRFAVVLYDDSIVESKDTYLDPDAAEAAGREWVAAAFPVSTGLSLEVSLPR